MKRTTLLVVVMLAVFSMSYATAGPQIPYQAVARDASGNLIQNQTIGLQFTIHSGSAGGTVVFQEAGTAATNEFGLFTYNIGTNTNLSGVSWGSATMFMQVGMDPTGGTSYTNMGTQQMIYVPYALYAQTSGNGSGPTGPMGANGANGAAGATGPTGSNGTNGATGHTGSAGAAGTNGTNGATGPTGAAGINGANGTNGTNGATGPTGANGNDGATGPTGAAGVNGTNGTNGTNGVTGPTGANGNDGATGPTGAAGVDGTNGTNGTNGATGPTGANGNDGATGPTGAAGTNGTNGTNGANGATGPTGSVGFLSAGTAAGNTPYWNGSSWVVNSSNIYNNGSGVGIGLTSPEQELSVNHGIALDEASSNTGTIINCLIFGHLSSEGIGSNRNSGYANQYGLDFYTNSANRMSITNGGNVGIGNSNPASLLHLGNSNTSGNTYLTIDASGSMQSALQFDSAGAQKWVEYRPASSNDLRFWDGTNDRLTLKNGGNVGIGTSSPLAPLTINSAATYSLSSGLVEILQNGVPTGGGQVMMKMGQSLSQLNEADIKFQYQGNNNGRNSLTFGFYGEDNMAHFYASGAADFGFGPVAIGTTSTVPLGGIGAAMFAINGANTSISGPHIQYTTSADNYPVFQQLNWSHDNVSLNFDAYYDATNWKNASASSPFQIYKIGSNLNFNYASAGTAGVAVNGTGAWSSGMVLAGSGDVGIGTTSPAQKLDVAGTIKSTGIQMTTSATSGYVLTSDGSGNGTWQPATGGGGLASGSAAGNTPYWNGSSWVTNSSNIYNDGSGVGIGLTSPEQELSVNHGIALDEASSNTGTIINCLIFGHLSSEGIGSNRNSGYANQYGLDFYTNSTKRMSITNGGYVGIGTSTPSYPLDIETSVTASYTNYGYLAPGGNTGFSGSGSGTVSFHCVGRILSSEVDVQSDERIKTNINHPQIGGLLDLADALQVADYEYIDKLAKGTETKRGFIAQQVESVFPNAVRHSTETIPSIFAPAQDAHIDGTVLTVTTGTAHGFTAGDEVLLYDNDNQPYHVKVATVASDKVFTVNDWKEKADCLFVYGKKVDDFRTVDFDQITALSVGAIQELSRQLKDAQERVKDLTAEKEKLAGKVNELQSGANEQSNTIKTMKAQIDEIRDRLNITSGK